MHTPILPQRFLVVSEKTTDSVKVQSFGIVRVIIPIAFNEPLWPLENLLDDMVENFLIEQLKDPVILRSKTFLVVWKIPLQRNSV